jgi:predicted nucleic acid-binding protein
MPTIVSNSTPLIHLARIGQLGLLRDFFGNVMIPPAVYVDKNDALRFSAHPRFNLSLNKRDHRWWVADIITSTQ